MRWTLTRFRQKRRVAFFDLLVGIDSALARGGLERQAFACHFGVPTETLRKDLSPLKRLGSSIRREVFRGDRDLYCYARDQVPLFSESVSLR